MDVGSLVSTALSILSIATLAGLGLLRGTVVNLREQLKDARDEIADLERRRERETTERTEQAATDATQIARLEAGIATLTSTVTGEIHWVALGEQLEQHHSAAEVHWRHLAAATVRLEKALTDLVDELKKGPPRE